MFMTECDLRFGLEINTNLKSNMAAACLSCSAEKASKSGKVLECSNKKCANFLHTECSVYRANELRFLEANPENIRWYCGGCVAGKGVETMAENEVVLCRLAALESMLKTCTDLIDMQGRRLQTQGEMMEKLLENVSFSNTETNCKQTNSLKRGKGRAEITENVVSNTSSTEQVEPPNTACELTQIRMTRSRKQASRGAEKQPALQPAEVSQTRRQRGNAADTTAITEDSDAKASIGDDGYKLVKYNRMKKTVIGRKTEDATLKAVDPRSWIFLSRLDPSTTEADVKGYVEGNGISVYECVKLDIRSNNIAAFKILVNRGQEGLLLSEDLWPVNTIVRYYRRPNFQAMARKSSGT